MPLFGKNSAPPPASAGSGALPFHHHAIPPAGTLGDNFDGLRNSATLAPQRRATPDAEPSVVISSGVPFRPRLHPLVLLSWVALLLGLVSTGPAAWLRLYWGLLAIALAVGGWLAIHFVHFFRVGKTRAQVSATASLLLLVLFGGHLERAIQGGRAMLMGMNARIGTLGVAPVGPNLGTDIAADRSRMEALAVAVSGLSQICSRGPGITIMGVASQDGMRPSAYDYEYVPMLNPDSECVVDRLPKLLPRANRAPASATVPDSPLFAFTLDRHSPDGGIWPYGVLKKDGFILVWSPGPDGRMDYSPAKDFRPSESGWREAITTKSYDPTNGAVSSGDIIVVHLITPQDAEAAGDF